MSATDFKLTDFTRLALICANGHVQFHFIVNEKQMGRLFLYRKEEAAALGAAIMKTGSWDECPVELSASDLRTFGQRLRDYSINEC
jgi:hypothetical protein